MLIPPHSDALCYRTLLPCWRNMIICIVSLQQKFFLATIELSGTKEEGVRLLQESDLFDSSDQIIRAEVSKALSYSSAEIRLRDCRKIMFSAKIQVMFQTIIKHVCFRLKSCQLTVDCMAWNCDHLN